MKDKQRQALEGVIKAWERLSSGNYHPSVVENWLKVDIKPAIDQCREALSTDSRVGELKELGLKKQKSFAEFLEGEPRPFEEDADTREDSGSALKQLAVTTSSTTPDTISVKRVDLERLYKCMRFISTTCCDNQNTHKRAASETISILQHALEGK